MQTLHADTAWVCRHCMGVYKAGGTLRQNVHNDSDDVAQFRE